MRGIAVLADVLLGSLVHRQVLHEAHVGRQDHPQLIAPHALHALQGDVVEVVGERCDDVDGQLVFTTQRSVIHLAGVGIVLAVAMADLALPDDAIKKQDFQLLEDVGCLDLGVLDLLFDVFFFVGQVLVDITIALDVSLLFQQVECSFKPLTLRGQVVAKTFEHQHAEVAQRGLELLDVLDQEECFEHAHGVRVAQMALGIVDGALDGALERATDSFEHAVERGQLAHRRLINGNRHFPEYAEHGALAHRVGLAFEAVVH
ncbi:hypothetical protein D9M72_368420 [compost metagenome]